MDENARTMTPAAASSLPINPINQLSLLKPSSTGLQFRGKFTEIEKLSKTMASPAPTVDPGLIAVAMIIRSRDGPRFVFHYPPQRSTGRSEQKSTYGTELGFESGEDEDTQVDSDEYDSDLEDGGFAVLLPLHKIDLNEKKKVRTTHVVASEGDDHFDTPSGEHVVPWEHLFEYSTTDLESILTPSRAYNKKKFELTLDPLRFISYPIHIREDGLWKKKKAKKSKTPKEEHSEAGMTSVEAEGGKQVEKGKAADVNNSDEDDDHGGMTMFNVVFVLRVSKEEASQLVAEIYEHVVKKFNKALNHAQASSNYVWKDSELILAMKDKAREESKPSIT